MRESGAPFSGMTPQVFACPSAELLLAAAGVEPGSLGATAHGAVCARMCAHIGGYSQLLAALAAAQPAANASGGGSSGSKQQ